MFKIYKSKKYNYVFNMVTGFMARWGKTHKDDPDYAPAPEILDIELSTVCSQGCKFCYKDNKSKGKNMSLKTFKRIFNKFPSNLTQVAFGIGDINANKDLWKILEYTRSKKVIPNITVNGNNIDLNTAERLSLVCGAVAVSHYNDDICFDAVNRLTVRAKIKEYTLRQVNIHKMLSEETYDSCFDLIDKCKTDKRLFHLNAIVFLMLKPKGRGVTYHPLKDKTKYRKLINYAIKKKIGIGFDSCSAFSFLNSVKNRQKYEHLVDPCESDCFSSYISVSGRYFHCSFTENEDGWNGIDMLKVKDFDKEIWNHPEVLKFRKQSIKNKKAEKACQLFNLDLEN